MSTCDFLLLAAGQSSRMHQDKALLDFFGTTWIEAQVAEVKKSNLIQQLVIVDQPGKTQKYKDLLLRLENESFKIHFVENTESESSPSDSIELAFQKNSFSQGVCLSPIDVPLKSSNLQLLLSSRATEIEILKPSFQGQGGHPVWLSFSAIEKFRQAPRRLDEFLADFPLEQVRFVEFDSPEVRMNLNTPEEWQSFLNRGMEHPKR